MINFNQLRSVVFYSNKSVLEEKYLLYAYVLAFIATFIWGTAFPVQKHALAGFTPPSLITYRYALAFLIGLGILFFKNRENRKLWPRYFRLAAKPGLFLGVMLVLQSYGIALTSLANSSFLTTLYAAFIPVIIFLFYRVKTPSSVWICVAASLTGMFLMCQPKDWEFNSGDILTTIGAFVGSFQILSLERNSQKILEPFIFNTMQSFWCFVVAVPFTILDAGFYHSNAMHLNRGATQWLAVLFLVGPSTMVAFYFQILAQKRLSSATVSLIFLLEAPVATAFGWLIYHEKLSTQQMLGGCLLMISAAAVISLEQYRNRKPKIAFDPAL